MLLITATGTIVFTMLSSWHRRHWRVHQDDSARDPPKPAAQSLSAITQI